METIKLSNIEQQLLHNRKQALDASREAIALQVSVDTIAALHGVGAGWSFTPDFSEIVPPAAAV